MRNTVAPILLASFAFAASTLLAETYTVRPDGGSPAQCTGLVDAPYGGTGSNQPCAWDHPFRALPPGGPARITGGDTLVIGSGGYMLGFGAPGANDTNDECSAEAAFVCFMAAIPSGPDPAHPTRIVGKGWDSGCAAPPQLWGTERTDLVVNMTGASNVELRCLEITDHSGCVEFHSGSIPCNRDQPPYGSWASQGIVASDSSNVLLQDLDIHGLASTGVHAGRLRDWTVENVRIRANGSAGWDGDIDGDDSNGGTLRFHEWHVAWNGCGESWPEREPNGCWAQEAGGYGDGVGTGETTGTWIIEDSSFIRNTSDGLDLLYCRPGSSIELRRVYAEGNAGNQIKTSGPVVMENVVAIGNCGFFEGRPENFFVDHCRALGNVLSLALYRGDSASIVNSTITGEGDCMLIAECSGQCDGTERVTGRNLLFVGQTDFLQPFELTCLTYEESFPADPFDISDSLVYRAKEDACPAVRTICGRDPLLRNMGLDTFDFHLTSASPAIDAGIVAGAPALDYDLRPRSGTPDIGASEWNPTVRRRPVRR